ncbi:hypothetical protein BU24DRAFT_424429 [Aaosphaeria arxii CBS 175.79]|uniref:F-box domain-containing protein n=1 Tax=Aaosphaeria arxii CBS 175.79 TaxID=1450172 RepID=A0A6A5XJX8_9PLEO|nr:uncharacterized protein BU24DRAFT_424429 [Aaosphaeria arxii CBS 175.79]KAF2013432.1 hypothetical protein BU24DRAFT_424429 [Aaosphaeria arxii CBS 175.79]
MKPVQTSLLDYFSILRPKLPTEGTQRLCFYDFPATVRSRILQYTGLIRDCPIVLNSSNNISSEHHGRDSLLHLWRDFTSHEEDWCYYDMKKYSQELVDRPDGYECVCDRNAPIPFALFLVSHSVSREALSMLYSRNKFILTASGPGGGLSCFQKLGTDGLSMITSLTIALTSCSCTPGHICNLPERDCACHFTCKRGYDDPLLKCSRRAIRLLDDLQTTLSKLAEHGNPSQLRLSVICDCADIPTAEFMVQPISPAFKEKPLRECAIRLGQTPSEDLRKIAERASREATGRPTRFRFTDLPEELQFRILEFTELVAPCDIVWCPRSGLYGQVACCLSCTDALEACCCSQLHAGYSTTCTNGNCWQFPHSIFLLNKKIYDDASRIFYRENHFVLVSGRQRDALPGPRSSPLTFSQALRPLRPSHRSPYSRSIHSQDPPVSLFHFLFALPQHALKQLRSIHWILDDAEPLLIEGNHFPRQEFGNAISLMAHVLDLPNLSLTIDMSRPLCQDDSRDVEPDSTLRAYRYISTALKPLRTAGLKSLFIHITYPFDWIDCANFANESRFEIERELERAAMGEEYDGDSLGTDVRVIRSRPHELLWERHAWWAWHCCRTRVDLGDCREINDNRPVLSVVPDDGWYVWPRITQPPIWAAMAGDG